MSNKYTKTTYGISALLGIFALIALVSMPISAHATYNGYYLTPAPTDGNDNSSDTVSTAAPIIYSINPDTVAAGTSTTRVLDITGAHFNEGLSARINGSPRPTTYESTSHMKIVIYPSDMAIPGTAIITAYDPENGYVSNSAYLNIVGYAAVATNTNTTVLVGDYPPTTTTTVKKTTTAKKATTTTTTAKKTSSSNSSNLSANALGAGFMPTTLIGWLLLALLIAAFIFLWRLFFVAKKDKEKEPLKKE